MNRINAAGVCVDDDPHILQMLSLQLRKCMDQEQILMDFFQKPEEVMTHLKTLQERGVELRFLLTDYRMPGMSGYDLIKSVKAEFPELKCILLSGQADQHHVSELKKDGLLDAFIGKPWKERELFALLGC